MWKQKTKNKQNKKTRWYSREGRALSNKLMLASHFSSLENFANSGLGLRIELGEDKETNVREKKTGYRGWLKIDRLKIWGAHKNTNQKKVGVAILISENWTSDQKYFWG